MQPPGFVTNDTALQAAVSRPAVPPRSTSGTVLPALTPELSAEPAPAAQTGLAIGSRIRILRRARGLTQDTLAMSTGVSRSAVAQWETGRAGQMGSKLRRIAEALGVSVSMLKEGWEGLATDSVLSSEEMSLLRLFRACSAEDRSVLMHVAQKLSSDPGVETDAEARRTA